MGNVQIRIGVFKIGKEVKGSCITSCTRFYNRVFILNINNSVACVILINTAYSFNGLQSFLFCKYVLKLSVLTACHCKLSCIVCCA